MKDLNNIFNEDFINSLDSLDLSNIDIAAIYAYLSIFENQLTDQEKAFWSVILEKKDAAYEKNKDSDSNQL